MNGYTWCKVFAAACLLSLTNCATKMSTPAIGNDVVESIVATSGAPQSHAVNGVFGAALVATVTTNGTPVSGVVVTFTAPATGASATFSDTSSVSASATTDENGVATSPSFTANGVAGPYAVTAKTTGVLTPATFALTNTTGAPAAIQATSGTPQSAPINTAFAAPLVATVVDSGKNPVSGAIVTFTAPAAEASGTFANGTATETDTTNAAGIATSTTFKANGISGADVVTATAAGVMAGASFNLTNTAGAPATISAASGATQSAAINTAFASPLVALVVDSTSNPVSGVVVTFTAPTTGATGTFANGTATEIDTTNASGLATSSTFTANGKTGGPYTVTASVASLSTTATFSLTNRVAGNTYVFSLSGQDFLGPNFYALVGSVQIDPNGNVLNGEQDYNDGESGPTGSGGVASPEPSGDTITGGSLSVSATTGQGTLILITNNSSLGVDGVETLGVQFANSNHAQIIQFDGTATSSGSFDLQTLPGSLTGGYAFTLTGVDSSYSPVGYGGVFSITNGTVLQNGVVDENDVGYITTATPLTGTLSTFDSFGRGTITSNLNYLGVPIVLNYYVVGPEAIRLIDVDIKDSAVGSAFGQGANQTTSSNSSLVNSVFGIAGNPLLVNYATEGMLVTSPSLGTFTGVADDNELFNYNIQLPAAPISGTYSIASNGYGNLTIGFGTFGDVSSLGVYMTDPNLNLNDPNNTTSGLGGGLIADMDSALAGGIGVLIPQTDTSTASFTGSYAFGAQAFYNGLEFDFIGQGSVTNGTLSGSGLVSDPFISLGANATNSGVTFSGTPLPDTVNVGRYSLFSSNPTPNPLNVTIGATTVPLDVAIYQASGGQLFWLDEDLSSVFFGLLVQQGSLAGIPGAGQGSTESITVTSGNQQSASVNTAFAAPLAATVTTNGSPTSGMIVTFTAPATGASGTFAGGTNTVTATTNASGVATSPAFTANGIAGTYTVAATVAGVSTAANFSLTNTGTETITATSGTPQSAMANTTFAAPLVATVTTGGAGTSGVTVTFTAPATGASGTFAGGTNTIAVTTDSNGVATSPAFTANGTIGSYTVTATVAGVSTAANFSLTNTAVETITATSGTPQSAVISTAFAAPLVATVTTGGVGTAGVVVTFTAPSTGASGTFAGATNITTVTTDVNGVATSPVFTANATTGAYTVTATVSGLSSGATFNLTNVAAQTITATSGTPQSTMINTTFVAPLVATVTGGLVTSGVQVTFTAPTTGASGTFAGGTNVVMVTTDSNGVATSPLFTANGTAGSYTVTATVVGVSAPVNFSLTNTSTPVETITATSGTPQTAVVDTAFAAPLVATVTTNGVGTSGVVVTFTAPSTGASGTFAGATNTTTVTTDSNGVATSPVFTANATVGSYTVTASVTGVTTPADFSLTNKASYNTYVFYLSGQEAFGPDYYALVGAVGIDSSGNVVAGEQDYNDGGYGLASPEPSGDTITGGTLAVNATSGQGTLTLITNNSSLGVGGVETLGIQFVNTNHAQIIAFDGVSATSSGGLDLQTLPTALSGGYAFTLSGVDNSYFPVGFGGVFSISGGTTLQNGAVDENDNGTITTATPLSGTLSTFDAFGRGTITTTLNYGGTPIALNYYVVGPEVFRMIDVDTSDSAMGSAFGQGVNATSAGNASLGTSVFGLNGSPFPASYATAGMFSTSNTSSAVADFSGVADDNEMLYGYQAPAASIAGTYSIASSGYGNFTIAGGDLGDVSALGIYMTDPNLNLNDPNNTTSGLGGGLFADMDSILAGGVGVLIPQTDTSTGSFTGNYVFGAQAFNSFSFEFDFVGQGSVTSGTLSGTGLISDPFLNFNASTTNSGATFTGTPLADTTNIGRYSLFSTNTIPNPLNVTIKKTTTPFDVAIYQASGGQLIWLDEDASDVFFGFLQQQGSLTGIPGAKKPPAKTEAAQRK